MILALVEAIRLKALDRAGWVRVGIAHPESVAAHSWGVSLLTLAFLPPELDRGRALAYATLHDLPECLAGDVTPHDGVSAQAKHDAERAAMTSLEARGLPPHLVSLWTAYEAQNDPEARFVQQVDKLEMALQALAYSDRAKVDEFVDSAASRIDHPSLLTVLEEIRRQLADQR
ncbi:MAG: HD domain-containing protein [Proteobacteria bacterium]|nr:HD domain-containing protein [Pseudomonadota bacterium]